MPAVAQKDSVSTVTATDGAQGSLCATMPNRYNWNTGTTQTSDEGSNDVFVENIGVVRENDAMISHADGSPCTVSAINHAPRLNTYSSNVFVNGKRIGRIGDKYNSDGSFDHTISSGAATVFANS